MAEQSNDISNLSLIELKALAFDQMNLIAQSQANMEVIRKQMTLVIEQSEASSTKDVE